MKQFISAFLRRPAPPTHPLQPSTVRFVSGASLIDTIGCLDEAEIFRDLNAQDMAEIESSTAMVTCRRGKEICGPESVGEVLFIVKGGHVNIYRLTPDGRKLVTTTLGPGKFFGELSLIGERLHGSFAEAAEDCTICVMSRSDVEHLIIAHPRVGLRLLEALASRLEETEGRLEGLAFKSVGARLATTLLRLAAGDGNEVSGITHQQLAEIVGTHRETATRALNDFRSLGLIDLQRQRIRILDPDGLRNHVDT